MFLIRLSLQRRRLYFAGLLVYLASLNLLGAAPDVLENTGPVSGAVGISAMSIGGYAALIGLFHGLRTLVETSALGILSTSAASWAGLLPDAPTLLAGPAGLAAIAALTSVWHIGLYGRWWHKVPLRLDWRAKRSFSTPKTAPDVWERLVPDPNNPSAHYTGTYLGEEPDAKVPGRTVQRTSAGPGLIQETTLDYETIDPPRTLAYSYSTGRKDRHCEYGAGHYRLSLAPQPYGTRVTVHETVHRLVTPTALSLWFDDFGGEMRLSMKAALAGTPDATRWLRDSRRAMPAWPASNA